MNVLEDYYYYYYYYIIIINGADCAILMFLL